MVDRNQRKHTRAEARFTAFVELSTGDVDGTIENIGEGGAFFVTDTLEGAVLEGDHLHLRFSGSSGEGEAVRLPGTALRIERYFHDGSVFRSIAIKFDEPYRRAPEAEAAV